MDSEFSVALGRASTNLRRLSYWFLLPQPGPASQRVGVTWVQTKGLLSKEPKMSHQNPLYQHLERLRVQFLDLECLRDPQEKAEAALYLSTRLLNLSQILANLNIPVCL